MPPMPLTTSKKTPIPFGDNFVMVCGCVSHDCKLDLMTVQGNLSGSRYLMDILETVVVPHSENHALATRPVFMDDNARPHRKHAVMDFLTAKCNQDKTRLYLHSGRYSTA